MDISTLIPQFGGVFTTILAFIVALSVIVAIHEYGHYIVGRWCGIRAEVFSLGFGPTLWSKVDRHGTRWQFALLPFGGYVKFLGDSNAASGKSTEDATTLSDEQRRRTMHGAPLWAKTATVAAGPVFNFILSIAVFALVMMSQGKEIEPLTVGALKPLPIEGITLEPGDEILTIAGSPIPRRGEDGPDFGDFIDALPKKAALNYEVRRGDRQLEVQGPYPQPVLVAGLAPQSAAYAIDMQPGDVIVSVDGDPVVAFSQLKEVVESSNGRVLKLEVWRAGELLEFALAPRRVDEPQPEGGFKTEWRIGISGGFAFDPATESLGPLVAVTDGTVQTWRIVQGSLSGLYHMVTGAISSCNMSGPIGIAQVSGAMASQGAQSFIWFIAVLSTAVGLLNLFPIPVLDGGHLVFFGYEAVTGKPPSDTAMRILMSIGLVFVLSLMVFALGNDLFCP